MKRLCTIISVYIGAGSEANDDGAYDLLDTQGDPAFIGKAIAESLSLCDLHGGARMIGTLEAGCPVFLTLTIRIDPVEETMNILDYFYSRLGEIVEPTVGHGNWKLKASAALSAISIDSPCGKQCVEIIDGVCRMMATLDINNHTALGINLRRHATNAVIVLVNG